MKLARATLKGKKKTTLCLAFGEIPALIGYGAPDLVLPDLPTVAL